MPHRSKTYVPPRVLRRTPLGTAIVLLLGLDVVIALFALFLAQRHDWSDRFLSRVPMPGTRTSMAADPGLMQQLRVTEVELWFSDLVDQSSTLVADVDVENPSSLPITNIVLEAQAFDSGAWVRTVSALCGLAVSPRLLGRLRREELVSLLDLSPPDPLDVPPGATVRCQIAFPGVSSGVDEVMFKVASAEPSPGHPAPLFRLAE